MLEWACAQELPPRPLIVDLCTGSGALAAALAARFPDARVVAVDDDPAALDYAAGNLSAAVELLRADVTAEHLLDDLAGTVDLMVANPPYIPLGTPLEAEVAEHDPAHALFGGADKVRFRRRVIPGDQLICEVNILKLWGSAGKVAVKARVGDEIAAEGFYTFRLVAARSAQTVRPARPPATSGESDKASGGAEA